MKAIFEAIKEVDMKWKELKLIESKNSSHGDRDLLEKYENQNKSNVNAGNKQLKQESELRFNLVVPTGRISGVASLAWADQEKHELGLRFDQIDDRAGMNNLMSYVHSAFCGAE